MISSDFCFIDLKFTSELEDKLDKISNKETTKLKVLTEFWDRLKVDIENAQTNKHKLAVTDQLCPTCSNPLLNKNGKYGKFYACSNKECKFTSNIGEDGKPLPKVKKEIEYLERKRMSTL